MSMKFIKFTCYQEISSILKIMWILVIFEDDESQKEPVFFSGQCGRNTACVIYLEDIYFNARSKKSTAGLNNYTSEKIIWKANQILWNYMYGMWTQRAQCQVYNTFKNSLYQQLDNHQSKGMCQWQDKCFERNPPRLQPHLVFIIVFRLSWEL